MWAESVECMWSRWLAGGQTVHAPPSQFDNPAIVQVGFNSDRPKLRRVRLSV